MAERKVNRKHFNDPDSLAAGTITYSAVANPDDAIVFDIRELCGFTKTQWEELNDYAKWSLLRDANNTHGDAFAADPDKFKELSQARHDKLAAGEFGKGSGGSAGKGMNDYIRALMQVASLDEQAARDYIDGLDDEVVQEENGLTELQEFKKHEQIVNARAVIQIERKQAQLAKAGEAPAFTLKK